jgi:hypothetical protein
MISMTSIQDLLTVRTKKFVNKGMDYEEFVINLLVSAVLSSFFKYRYILLKTEQKATGLIKYKVKTFVDYL